MNSENIKLLKRVKYFLTDYLPKQQGASPNTIKSYKETLNQFFGYLQKTRRISLTGITFELLTKENVVSYLGWVEDVCGNSVSTRNQRLSCIHSFAKQSSGTDLILKAQFMELGEIPVKKDLKSDLALKFFSEDVLTAMLAQPNPKKQKDFRDLFFMSLLYDTGARVQELLDLKPRDIHPDALRPYVILKGKGSKTRLVPLMPNTVKLFRSYMKIYHDTSPAAITLFYVRHRLITEPMSQDCVAKFIEKYRVDAKKVCAEVPDSITPHMFRHSRSMDLYRGGMPLPILSEWLGHNKMETTLNYYANADTKMKQEAIDRATSVLNPLRKKLPTYIDTGDDEITKRLYGLT